MLYGARTTLMNCQRDTGGSDGYFALIVGTLSGYYGGWLDTLLMGLVDLLLAFPSLDSGRRHRRDPGP